MSRPLIAARARPAGVVGRLAASLALSLPSPDQRTFDPHPDVAHLPPVKRSPPADHRDCLLLTPRQPSARAAPLPARARRQIPTDNRATSRGGSPARFIAV
jgi:hypothetical protein